MELFHASVEMAKSLDQIPTQEWSCIQHYCSNELRQWLYAMQQHSDCVAEAEKTAKELGKA